MLVLFLLVVVVSNKELNQSPKLRCSEMSKMRCDWQEYNTQINKEVIKGQRSPEGMEWLLV